MSARLVRRNKAGSRVRPSIVGSCLRKERYTEEEAARRAAHLRDRTGRDDAYAYACFFCGGFHVGRADPRGGRR